MRSISNSNINSSSSSSYLGRRSVRMFLVGAAVTTAAALKQQQRQQKQPKQPRQQVIPLKEEQEFSQHRDFVFNYPFTMIVSGPTSCGKTMEKMLQPVRRICKPCPERIVCCTRYCSHSMERIFSWNPGRFRK